MFQCYVDCGQNDSFLFLFSLSTYVLQWESAPPTHASKSTKVIRNANTPDKIKYRGKSEILEYAMHYKIVGTTATQLLLSHHRHSPAAPQRPHRTRRQHMEGNQRRVMRIASHLCGGNHGGAVAPRTNTLFFFFFTSVLYLYNRKSSLSLAKRRHPTACADTCLRVPQKQRVPVTAGCTG